MTRLVVLLWLAALSLCAGITHFIYNDAYAYAVAGSLFTGGNEHDYLAVQRRKQSVDKAFAWDEVDLASPAQCGAVKCFFHSKVDESEGFLIGFPITNTMLEILKQSWFLAKAWETRFTFRHFMADPPTITTIRDHTLVSNLNSVPYSYRFNEWEVEEELFEMGMNVTVQRVQKAPTPNYILGCAKTKTDHMKKHWAEFLATVPNATQFVLRFEIDLNAALAMAMEETCLFFDFQILVDQKGNVFHLDFDRCFFPTGLVEKRESLDRRKNQNCRNAMISSLDIAKELLI